MPKKKKKPKNRSAAQKKRFTKTKIPLDKGYVKPTKDGGRLHKYSTRGKIHKDKANPARDPIGHIQKDVIGKRLKKVKKRL